VEDVEFSCTSQLLVSQTLRGIFHVRGSISSTLGALLLCVACVGSPASEKTDSLRVALLTPGPISDQAWNGEAYRGLLAVRDSLGASISHIQTRTPASFDENFREYGRQGYDLVIGHGFEYKDAAERIAPSFPMTVFLVTSSEVTGTNVAGIKFSFAQPSYLAGIAAAGASKSGTIGAIGGTELPPVREGFDAYAAGARSVNPQIQVLVSYVGNWEDVSAGREQALAQMSRGADVIFQNADAAGLGVFQAARESGRALVIGANADQNGVAPGVVLGSAVIDLPMAFLTVARTVRDHTPLPGVFTLGAETGVVKFAINPALADRISAAARARLDSTWGLMSSGRWQAADSR
jgi:basic membrane lipoprotein Med (substrate-binding protein (PBP1-ABC) superfamily)